MRNFAAVFLKTSARFRTYANEWIILNGVNPNSNEVHVKSKE